MAAFKKYVTQPLDRWADIAQLAWGQPEKWPEIAAANPAVALVTVFTPGTVIFVPIISTPANATTTVGLPSWKS